MMKAYLLLLLLSASSFACISNATDIVMSEQGTNIMIILSLTTIVIAIAYMVGSVLQKPEYSVYAKDEMYHLGFSVLLLVSFSGILVFSCFLMDFFYTSFFQESGMFGEAGMESRCYMDGLGMNEVASCYAEAVSDDAQAVSESYIDGYVDQLMSSTFSWSFQIPLVNSLTSTGGAFRRVVSNQYDIILNTFLVPAMVSISMQKIAIDFISENVIQWILPIGFLLRFFMLTREMGNIVIALSFGLYILVPFLYVFNFAMYEGVLVDCYQFVNEVCDNVFDSYCQPPQVACTNIQGFWNVGRLIPMAFFLPNLTIALFVTFLAAVNKALRVVG